MGEDLKPIDISALIDARIMEVVVPSVRRESAQLIRDELVCCNVYQRLTELWSAAGNQPSPEYMALRKSIDYHSICYFGEWSARIVERGPRE